MPRSFLITNKRYAAAPATTGVAAVSHVSDHLSDDVSASQRRPTTPDSDQRHSTPAPSSDTDLHTTAGQLLLLLRHLRHHIYLPYQN